MNIKILLTKTYYKLFPELEEHFEEKLPGYDAAGIKEVVENLGRVPIIDFNPRGGPKVELPNDRVESFKNRSSVERVNGNLKDNFGGKSIRVKGAAKVISFTANLNK